MTKKCEHNIRHVVLSVMVSICDACGAICRHDALTGEMTETPSPIGKVMSEQTTPEMRMREVVTAVRADLARYRDDYPNGTRFASTEIALQCLDKLPST